MILVVGASGYLGGLVCYELLQHGYKVRAMVRPTAKTSYLKSIGVSLTYADLSDLASLRTAVRGCTAVVYTANAFMPTLRNECAANDGLHLANMVQVASEQGVSRFVLVSCLPQMAKKLDTLLLGQRLLGEQFLRQSSLNYTIVRCGLLMEVYMALLGSSLPTTAHIPGLIHTLNRCQAFGHRYYNKVRANIDQQKFTRLIGSGKNQVSWVASYDVARFCVASIDNPACNQATLEIGLPPISWLDTVNTFTKVLQRPIQVKHIPASAFRLAAYIISLCKPAAGEFLLHLSVATTAHLVADAKSRQQLFPHLELQTVEQFLLQCSNGEDPAIAS